MTAEDASLLQRLARGDRSAMNELAARHLDFVYSAARRRVGDAHLAQDVAQAVFVILTAKARRLGPNVVLAGWLYRTTAYVAANAIKQRRRREHHERAAASERREIEMPQTQADPDTLRQLDDAMLSLGSANRDAILLHYFQRRPLAEVAAMLGITEPAARKRIARAVEQLRSMLTRKGRNDRQASAANVAALLTSLPHESAPSSLYAVVGQGTAAPTVHALTHGVTFMMMSKQVGIAASVAALLLLGAATFIAVSAKGDASPQAAAPVALPPKGNSTTIPQDGRLTARMPWGSVQCIAVGTATGTADDQWWSPADSRRDQPFDHFDANLSPEPGKTMRAFVLDVTSTDNENGPITSTIAVAGAGEQVEGKATDASGRSVRVHVANVADKRPATVQVRFATGPWNLIDSLTPETRTQTPQASLISVVPARPRGTDARVRCDPSGDLRALAIDHAGQAHPMWANQFRTPDPNDAGAWNVNFYTRDIAPEDVAEIRVQRRGFDTLVEFSELTIDPATPATPAIHVTDATARPAAK